MTVDGVRFLDHTADVGMDVDAPSLPDLLRRAAGGMLALLRGDDEPDDVAAHLPPSSAGIPARRVGESTRIELTGERPVDLLAGWLRELLFLHEVERRDYVSADFDRIGDQALSARVRTERARPAVREIKGVTYHELEARRSADGAWRARVIFDV